VRPRLLSMTAFGPYAGTEVIDFRPLAGRDLFLIEGPTGSGKTAILDAMTFALYGVVPGARDQVKGELRSGWADPSARCEVSFEFELGDKVYRAHRVPEQERPRKRGTGTTTERAQASLVEVDRGLERPLCRSQVIDVDREVKRLIGLDAAQWKQVILLPQGDFRRFLLASSQEKEALLEHLFGTTLYKDVAERLKQERLRREEEIHELRARRDQLLGHEAVKDAAELGARAEALTAELAVLAERAREADELAQQRTETLEQGRAVLLRFVERERVTSETARLAAETPAIREKRRRLERNDAASPLAPALARDERARAAAERTRTVATKLGEERRAAELTATQAAARAAERPALEARIAELRGQEGRLEQLVLVETQAARVAATMTDLGTRQRAAKQRVETVRARSEAAAAAIAGIDQQLTTAHAAALGAAERGVAAERARAELAEQRETDVARGRVRDLTLLCREVGARAEARASDVAAIEAALRAARAEREAHLAAELAARLIAGEACAVCGSTSHPSPAVSAGRAVGADELAEYEEQLRRSRDALVDASARAAEAKARATAAIEEVARRGPLQPLADLEAKVLRLDLEAAVAARAAAEIGRLDEERRQRQRALAEDQERLAADDAALRELEQAFAAAQREHESLAAQLGEAGVAAGQVAARRTTVASERATLEREAARVEAVDRQAREALERAKSLAGRAEEEAKEAALEAQEAAAELATGLVAHDFPDAAKARAAILTPAEVARLREEVTAWERRAAAVEELATALAAELGDRARPDVARLQREATEAAKDAALAHATLGGTRERRDNLVRLGETAATLLGREEALMKSLESFGRLAQVVNGGNTLNMSLSRFVLASRMDEVAIAASERLLTMSRGRYLLRRTDHVHHAGRSSGLDLVVEDRQTGHDRSVQSLSGGEMFMASLALAMGLADTVQAHAGGVRMDSLFIDEGFGTLDDETLDQVMRTLADLRAAGRLVGIISHVPELKDRLPVRLAVRRTPRGSRTELVL
jgi:DNA repair protein SbcC/Rad50